MKRWLVESLISLSVLSVLAGVLWYKTSPAVASSSAHVATGDCRCNLCSGWWQFRHGDKVDVVSGPYRGRTGRVVGTEVGKYRVMLSTPSGGSMTTLVPEGDMKART